MLAVMKPNRNRGIQILLYLLQEHQVILQEKPVETLSRHQCRRVEASDQMLVWLTSDLVTYVPSQALGNDETDKRDE